MVTRRHSNRHKVGEWLLRIGLAGVFAYAAIGSLLQPSLWIGFLPFFLRQLVAGTLLISIFAAYELMLAAWLLSGLYVRYSGLLAAITLLGIVIANPSDLIITFRDIGLAFMGAALFFTADT